MENTNQIKGSQIQKYFKLTFSHQDKGMNVSFQYLGKDEDLYMFSNKFMSDKQNKSYSMGMKMTKYNIKAQQILQQYFTNRLNLKYIINQYVKNNTNLQNKEDICKCYESITGYDIESDSKEDIEMEEMKISNMDKEQADKFWINPKKFTDKKTNIEKLIQYSVVIDEKKVTEEMTMQNFKTVLLEGEQFISYDSGYENEDADIIGSQLKDVDMIIVSTDFENFASQQGQQFTMKQKPLFALKLGKTKMEQEVVAKSGKKSVTVVEVPAFKLNIEVMPLFFCTIRRYVVDELQKYTTGLKKKIKQIKKPEELTSVKIDKKEKEKVKEQEYDEDIENQDFENEEDDGMDLTK